MVRTKAKKTRRSSRSAPKSIVERALRLVAKIEAELAARRSIPIKVAAATPATLAKLKRRTSRPIASTAGLGPFAQEGELTWAVLAPIDAAELDKRVVAIKVKRDRAIMWDYPERRTRTWCVVRGKKQYAAMIETAYGSASGEADIAAPLSKAIKQTVYALCFGGYNDPDKGLPSISRYDRGKSGLIWMADSYDDDTPLDKSKSVPGPKGVRCDDPFAFASALGLDLRAYYD